MALEAKVQLAYDHLLGTYDDDDWSVDAALELLAAGMSPVSATAGPLDLDRTSETIVERTRTDPQPPARVAAELEAPGRDS